MTPNSDNAVARFLFAILRQKNLKDINWDAVARDPVLLQPISNGHAARMRYSRFRSTVLGTGSQKKKAAGDKHRVTKPKKVASPVPSKRDIPVKPEPEADMDFLSQFKAEPDSKLALLAELKSQSGFDLAAFFAQFSPTMANSNIPSPYLREVKNEINDLNIRFPTSAEDTSADVGIHPHALMQENDGLEPHCPAGNNDYAPLSNSQEGVPSLSQETSMFDDAFQMDSSGAVGIKAENPSHTFDVAEMYNLPDFGHHWNEHFPARH